MTVRRKRELFIEVLVESVLLDLSYVVCLNVNVGRVEIRLSLQSLLRDCSSTLTRTHTHAHTHTYIYIERERERHITDTHTHIYI